jgi:N-acetylmuramoyl-L-alanine amidase
VADNFYDQLSIILTPRSEESASLISQPQLRIGIVAGHSGNDSGAVCMDGNGTVTLTEADVNLKIAAMVQEQLTQRGYQVDLLREYDTRLNGYRALAIVSIHNDSCEYINDQATGFKVAAALNTNDLNRANRLTACLVDRYQSFTQMNFHAGSITADMREYHSFREIDPTTVAAIIETGFLNLDREILTKQTDRIAEGVVEGILCFANNENIEPTLIPNMTP